MTELGKISVDVNAKDLVVVLGAGIAGLAAADSLRCKGYRVVVIDKAAAAGGAHRSSNIGPYTFDAGSIFYEDGAKLFELAPEASDRCPTVIRVQRRIAPTGEFLHYPLEPRDILKQSGLSLPMGLFDFAWSRLFVKQNGSLDKICEKRLGRRFFRTTGLQSYITRFNHVQPQYIDEAFFFHRMSFIDRMTRLNVLLPVVMRSLFSRKTINAKTRKPLHVRPREGFGAIFEPVVARLRTAGMHFHFGEGVRSIKRDAGEWRVMTDCAEYRAASVVSTIPLEELHVAMFDQSAGLISLNMTTLFVSCDWLAAGAGNVLFNFHEKGWWKRATIYSRIYPNNGNMREYLAVECTIPPGGSHDPQARFEDFRQHIEGLGLAGDLALEGHELVENAYPLYSPGSVALRETALERVADAGVIAVGRQGRFEYLPTSSGVIRRVAEELHASDLHARRV